ncbi:MAG: hypothetical protein QOE59_1030 [Actinomycetota bacterium]|jgi:hypothetical protein|nr:hypothetical protein [Actinomycetota bacterium]
MNTTDVTSGTAPVSRAGLLRVGLHLLLAALPLLAISAHVFGLITMNWSAALLVVPLATAIVALTVFAPHPEERVILHGFVWGMVACALYDVFRLDTVYMLGWWADFIPTMGTWIVGHGASRTAGAWVGYLWRYLGDGGGIGVTFFVGAAFLGLHRRPPKQVVGAAVAFAVFPVWAGLIATVSLAPRGQSMMFPLTPVTVTLSLIGHLIFGLIMGLGFVRTRSAQRFWPWAPLRRGDLAAALAREAAADSRPVLPPAERPSAVLPPPPPPRERVAPRHPSGPLPAASGPLPVAATSGPLPRQERVGAGHPSGPLPTAVGSGSSSGRSSTGRSSTGPATGRTRTATPPAGQTLDPETWALWQRQLATTIKGRRTHRWR